VAESEMIDYTYQKNLLAYIAHLITNTVIFFFNAKYEMRLIIIIASESRYLLKYKDYVLYYQTTKNVCIKVSEYFTSNKMSDSMWL